VLEPLLAEVNSPLYRPLQIISFKQFTQRWEDRMFPELKRSTVLAYRSILHTHLEPYFGQVRVQDISPEMVQMFVAQLTLNPKTTRNVLMLLKAMLRDAIRWGYLRANPCEAVRLPHAIPPERPAFTLNEVRDILAHASEPYRTLYWLAFETGMRAGELCGLRAEDVNVQKCLVQVRQSVWRGRVQTPKSQAAYRDIFISQSLTGHLQSLVEQRAEPPMHFLFHTHTGSAWDANAITKKRLAPLCKTLGIEAKGLHAFRRTHGTMMDRLGVPLKVRQERMGHTDPRLTLTAYTQPVSEDERRFVTQLAGSILPIDLDANRLQKEKAEPSGTAKSGL
jgi:integrase